MSTRARFQSFNTSGTEPVTGIIIAAPTAAEALSSTSFQWANTTLPHYDVTYIFNVKYSSHNYYYTNFFYNNDYNTPFSDEANYYGCHPFPGGAQGDGAPTGYRRWEISTNLLDQLGNAINYDQWYKQAVIVSGSSAHPVIDYYVDLANGSEVVSYTWGATWVQSGSPNLIFCDNPWTSTPSEAMDGTMRNIQIYNKALSLSEVQTEIISTNRTTPATTNGRNNVWYRNLNPTPSDISDKSGAGNNPSWTNANRPTLYQG